MGNYPYAKGLSVMAGVGLLIAASFLVTWGIYYLVHLCLIQFNVNSPEPTWKVGLAFWGLLWVTTFVFNAIRGKK